MFYDYALTKQLALGITQYSYYMYDSDQVCDHRQCGNIKFDHVSNQL